MELSALFTAVRKNWTFAASGVLVGLLASFAVLMTSEVVYRSTSEVFLTTPGWGGPTTLGNVDNSPFRGDEFSRQRAQTYIRVVEGVDFAQRVSDRMQGTVSTGDVSSHLSVRVVPDTVLLEVTAGSTDPVLARDTASAAAAQLSADIERLETPAGLTVSTVQPVQVGAAAIPTEPSSPRTMMILLCGLTLGALAGLSAVVVRERLRRTVDDPRVVADLVEAPVVGTAPAPAADDVDAGFDAIRYDLQFRGPAVTSGSMVVTSARSDDGRTSTVEGLARAYARAGASVVTVDADFRSDSTAGDALGLSNVVAGDTDVRRVIGTRDGVDHVPTGAHPLEPARVLEHLRFAETVRELAQIYDVVIVDAPALADVDDARTIARITDVTIMAVPLGRITPGELARAVADLVGVGVRVDGVVLTHTATARTRSGYTAPSRHDMPSPFTAQTGTVNR